MEPVFEKIYCCLENELAEKSCCLTSRHGTELLFAYRAKSRTSPAISLFYSSALTATSVPVRTSIHAIHFPLA